MVIYEKERMYQKVVYPTKQTPSYADWALFEMGKELEAHGGSYDPAQDVIFQTATGVKPVFVEDISVTVDDGTPTEITLGEDTYTLEADESSDAYVMTSSDTFIGYVYFYGDIEVGDYIGANMEISDVYTLKYGTIKTVNVTPGE